MTWDTSSALAQAGPGAPDPPTIQNFTASQIGTNTWQLSGQVVCSEPAYLTVTLGGLNGLLDTDDCTADEYGNFTYTFILMTHTTGYATAQVMDDWNQESEVEEAYID